MKALIIRRTRFFSFNIFNIIITFLDNCLDYSNNDDDLVIKKDSGQQLRMSFQHVKSNIKNISHYKFYWKLSIVIFSLQIDIELFIIHCLTTILKHFYTIWIVNFPSFTMTFIFVVMKLECFYDALMTWKLHSIAFKINGNHELSSNHDNC